MLWLPKPGLIGFGGGAAGNLEVIHKGLSAANAGTTETFPGLSYGHAADANRYMIAGLSGEDSLASDESMSFGNVELGGVSLSKLAEVEERVSTTGLCCALYGGLVPTGSSGDLDVQLRVNGFGAIWDSLGVTIWANSDLVSTTPIETNTGATNGSSTLTAFNLETEEDGFIIMLAVGAAHNTAFSSAAGNGSTGSLGEVIDDAIESDHRHAAYSKDGTPAGTTEDFTVTRASGGYWLMAALTMR